MTLQKNGKFNILFISLVGFLMGCSQTDQSEQQGEIEASATQVILSPTQSPNNITEILEQVHGAGATAGNTNDVLSLGYEEGVNNSVVLGWNGKKITNGEGVDFVVFENPFTVGNSENVFMDLIIVAVSQDGAHWATFPHDYQAADEQVYSSDPNDWVGFAGKTPVLYNDDFPTETAFDPALAGGDGFDLSTLGEDPISSEIKANGFSFVRLTAAPSQTNPDTGEPFAKADISNGPDIDGVIARYLR